MKDAVNDRPGGRAERVILVDRTDSPIGTEDKLRAHRLGRLHRAFSIFVFHPAGPVLLQRRAAAKYHSGGLWCNTCCSHPRPGESVGAAARRRLREEMGITCGLRPAFAFIYRAQVDGGLIEHEYDHVLIGQTTARPRTDPREVADWRWVDRAVLDRDVRARPSGYAAWFRIAWPMLRDRLSAGRVANSPGAASVRPVADVSPPGPTRPADASRCRHRPSAPRR